MGIGIDYKVRTVNLGSKLLVLLYRKAQTALVFYPFVILCLLCCNSIGLKKTSQMHISNKQYRRLCISGFALFTFPQTTNN